MLITYFGVKSMVYEMWVWPTSAGSGFPVIVPTIVPTLKVSFHSFPSLPTLSVITAFS